LDYKLSQLPFPLLEIFKNNQQTITIQINHVLLSKSKDASNQKQNIAVTASVPCYEGVLTSKRSFWYLPKKILERTSSKKKNNRTSPLVCKQFISTELRQLFRK